MLCSVCVFMILEANAPGRGELQLERLGEVGSDKAGDD